jgi:SpoVK/Ycf46/Vps4 family AAA+-type ATPase
MGVRLTKEISYIKLSEQRIREIETLVNGWPNETKVFMRARLNQYSPPSYIFSIIKKVFRFVLRISGRRKFIILNNPDILTNWQKRFELSGESNPQEAWNKILEKEISRKDYKYILALLDKELVDVHVPHELRDLFKNIYKAHIRKEYLSDHSVPKAPLLLITGTSGSGKTATIDHTIDTIIFQNEAILEVDLKKKKEERLENEPIWRSLEEVDPELNDEIRTRKRLKFYKIVSHIPIIKTIFKKIIGKNLSELEEQGIYVDYSVVTPNDYQTAYAGEPGNYLKKAMGDVKRTSIRHLEEAHSAFGKADTSEQGGVARQQRTLIDTSNLILDEVINGRRDCFIVASTDQPEKFDPAIYRRFVEKGTIIDISKFWNNPKNLRELVRLELSLNDIHSGKKEYILSKTKKSIPLETIDEAVQKIILIFKEKNLKITPSYVRKLIHSIINIKKDFKTEYFDESDLVKKAFVLVAQNAYGELFGKVVDKMDRSSKWEEYIGLVKNKLSEMANNCLYYGISEEKGVVLNGPPGSGKTFLVRSWLSENPNVHDISASPNDLFDSSNPYDGALENLENIYDIAKMIAPSVVFFDEGDSLAPKRSSAGGSPSDKLTNKFLSLIDGEIPLNKVFTVLTTNRIDIMDPALIRSKRLKVLEISGQLRQEDIAEIIRQPLNEIPLVNGIDHKTIVESASSICNTPADYTAFIEKALSLRSTEYAVVQKLKRIDELKDKEKDSFFKLNFKTLLGILESLDAPHSLRSAVKHNHIEYMNHITQIKPLYENVNISDDYPLSLTHLHSAKDEISESPVNQGKIQLDEYLEAELSQEPQIGFIIGVGASDVSGVLLPIASNLTYKFSKEKVMVTGAVSSSTSATAQMELSVKMTSQSAQEALTLVKNYFQYLVPDLSIAKILGNFLEGYTIHHQLLSASYNVGGPSAGYALAINTLSAILMIPVCNDFGITGAPWTKGATKEDIGGSVIIGGHKKKTETVLKYLKRMFMPVKNYNDFSEELLESYWAMGKDVLQVRSFGLLIPEVLSMSSEHYIIVNELVNQRINFKLNKYLGEKQIDNIETIIEEKSRLLKINVENEIKRRLYAIYEYISDENSDTYAPISAIFKTVPPKEELNIADVHKELNLNAS